MDYSQSSDTQETSYVKVFVIYSVTINAVQFTVLIIDLLHYLGDL